jgi:N-glycosylase/DNA lyase
MIQDFKSKKKDIRKRLKEFKELKKASKNKKFLELCYCLCTPLSNAKKVYGTICYSNRKILLEGTEKQVQKLLKGNCRFHNNKAKYIVQARDFIKNLDKLPKKGEEARELLIENVNGLGYKEASHFLRNIGYKDLAILDGHIINSLFELGVFRNNKRPSNKNEYLQMEHEMKKFAKQINIKLDELDLLLWSNKTGEILK